VYVWSLYHFVCDIYPDVLILLIHHLVMANQQNIIKALIQSYDQRCQLVSCTDGRESQPGCYTLFHQSKYYEQFEEILARKTPFSGARVRAECNSILQSARCITLVYYTLPGVRILHSASMVNRTDTGFAATKLMCRA
jgi:hypothetical protein